MTLKPMVVQSCVGPIGLPYDQAQYPGIGTADGSPIMAKEHYVIRMTKEELPPAKAFWSATLYDARKGLFIPNDHHKYSVGDRHRGERHAHSQTVAIPGVCTKKPRRLTWALSLNPRVA